MLSRRDLIALLAIPVLPGQEAETSLFGDAAAYDGYMGRWSQLLAPLLLDFADIPNGGRVLDVGSGTGSLSFAIASKKARCTVVGIDPSKQYVAYAVSRNRFGPRASFEEGDAQRLRFGAASFDHSLSLLVFNFIPDPAKALREVARVTKPGGRVAAAVWDYGAGMQMLRTFWDAAVTVDANAADEKNMPLSHAGELGELWRKGGLVSVTEKPLDFTMHFQSFADYWEPFKAGQGPAGALMRRLPAPQIEKLREEVKRRLQVSAEASPFHLPARAWAVRGTVAK